MHIGLTIKENLCLQNKDKHRLKLSPEKCSFKKHNIEWNYFLNYKLKYLVLLLLFKTKDCCLLQAKT